jgi:hypothetical protein
MSQTTSQAYELTSEDFNKIKSRAVPCEYKKGSTIFSESDTADHMYFIETGRVSVFIQEFTQQKELSILGPGEHFGEMAFFNGDKRSASVVALEDITLLSVDRNTFLDIYENDQDIAAKIDNTRFKRNVELTSEETLFENIGDGKEFHIGIKGDPSLRESAFTRERYESVVDQYLPLLRPQLYDLLLNRSAYEASIHFNSGELHIRTVLDPFNIEVHPASKLVNKGYIERHFQMMGYEEKTQMVQRIYASLGNDPSFDRLPELLGKNLRKGFSNWQPVSPAELTRVLSKLPLLRKIQNFYIRNFTISTIRDTIRMQFNCDGTHIVNADSYMTFIDQNLDMDELEASKPSVDRRTFQRRTIRLQDVTSPRFGERRTPPGRREEDWLLASSYFSAE